MEPKNIRINKKIGKAKSFARYIANVRKKENLTQKSLAEKINVSDRTISKWENDLTVPDLYSIKSICIGLKISPNALILSQLSFIDYVFIFSKILGSFIKMIFNNIVKIILFVILIFLAIYFINNFNVVNIYSLTYESKDITIKNGIFIQNKGRNTLLVNNISINDLDYEYTDLDLSLYVLVNGDKIVLYESDNLDDILIQELNGYPDVLKNDVIKTMKNNLFLDVKVTDINLNEEIYKCKIVFIKEFSNDKFIYQTYKSNSEYRLDYEEFLNGNVLNKEYVNYMSYYFVDDYRDSLDFYEEDVIVAYDDDNNKLRDLGYDYDKRLNKYYKFNDNKEIIYQNDVKLLFSQEIKNNYEYRVYYYILKNRIDFVIYDIDIKVSLLKYYVKQNSVDCREGDCQNYLDDIEYILAEYKAISEIL